MNRLKKVSIRNISLGQWGMIIIIILRGSRRIGRDQQNSTWGSIIRSQIPSLGLHSISRSSSIDIILRWDKRVFAYIIYSWRHNLKYKQMGSRGDFQTVDFISQNITTGKENHSQMSCSLFLISVACYRAIKDTLLDTNLCMPNDT